jgi:hypothetical protein
MSSTADPKPEEKPGIFQNIWSRIVRTKPTGVHCEFCGWNGTTADVISAPKVNEDGAVYQIKTCPSCMRNGGLIFYD